MKHLMSLIMLVVTIGLVAVLVIVLRDRYKGDEDKDGGKKTTQATPEKTQEKVSKADVKKVSHRSTQTPPEESERSTQTSIRSVSSSGTQTSTETQTTQTATPEIPKHTQQSQHESAFRLYPGISLYEDNPPPSYAEAVGISAKSSASGTASTGGLSVVSSEDKVVRLKQQSGEQISWPENVFVNDILSCMVLITLLGRKSYSSVATDRSGEYLADNLKMYFEDSASNILAKRGAVTTFLNDRGFHYDQDMMQKMLDGAPLPMDVYKKIAERMEEIAYLVQMGESVECMEAEVTKKISIGHRDELAQFMMDVGSKLLSLPICPDVGCLRLTIKEGRETATIEVPMRVLEKMNLLFLMALRIYKAP